LAGHPLFFQFHQACRWRGGGGLLGGVFGFLIGEGIADGTLAVGGGFYLAPGSRLVAQF